MIKWCPETEKLDTWNAIKAKTLCHALSRASPPWLRELLPLDLFISHRRSLDIQSSPHQVFCHRERRERRENTSVHYTADNGIIKTLTKLILSLQSAVYVIGRHKEWGVKWQTLTWLEDSYCIARTEHATKCVGKQRTSKRQCTFARLRDIAYHLSYVYLKNLDKTNAPCGISSYQR